MLPPQDTVLTNMMTNIILLISHTPLPPSQSLQSHKCVQSTDYGAADQTGWPNEFSVRLTVWEIVGIEPMGSNPDQVTAMN